MNRLTKYQLGQNIENRVRFEHEKDIFKLKHKLNFEKEDPEWEHSSFSSETD